MNKQSKKVTLQVAAFAALFGLMTFFMEMMEETEEQVTYSITLQDLANANSEADGENTGGGGADGESDDPVWGGLDNFLIGQGFYKDEKEYERPCPTTQQEGPSVTIGIGRRGRPGVTISEGSSTTNPPNRMEIKCKYGSTNCSTVNC